ncbi:MAG: PBP1A family penicillin-binding protein [Chromatiales bacterium]|jgi:penicillin-binding protein 1A|nr:MAG: PBP1A family penicillin-binding protein [Chromatiales bacterium]
MKYLIQAFLGLFGVALTLLIAAGAAGAAAWYFLSPGLPSVEIIREVPLQMPLRVYSRDGRLIAQLGEFRRMPVRYADIPDVLVEAVLAAEDDRFFEHPGFDYQGLVRAGANLVLTGQRTQGGSTITQQLARAYFLTPERTFVRKAKELLLALQIEQEFSKEEILALYLNKIFLGQRAYGIAAAAEVYFGKGLNQLNLAEAALLAGIPKAPSVLNPVSDPERARDRRAYVLRRMLELAFIDEAEYAASLASPVESKLHGPAIELDAPYIAEMVRAEMVARFGNEATTAGYRVVTTVDSRLQAEADRALRTALLEYDRRHGFRGPLERDVLSRLDGTLPDEQALQRLLDPYPVHPDLFPAVVTSLNGDNAATLFVHDIGYITVPWSGLRWKAWVNDDTVGPTPLTVADMVAVGDVVYLLRTMNRGWLLAQLPSVQGALVSLDPKDGATVALSGGYDFFASKFNRAVQAKRQPGSSFKPFVYSAALEHGFTPATVINDAPIVFESTNPDQDVWRPENNTGRFYGPTRLREGMVKSLNLVSIRVLLRTGIGPAIRHIKPFGFPDSAMPRNPTMVLGSGAAAPRDMAAGFAGFANGGHRIDPYLVERIEDAHGAVVFEAPRKVVCLACVDEWASDAQQPSTSAPSLLPGMPASDRAPTRPGQEIPLYLDAAEMMAHAGNWQPTVSEAPEFLAGAGQAPRIITAENAYLMYDIMRDVIRRGTGRRALALGRSDLAGKTGTSNDRRDAWFSGFNGELVATAWVGFDQERTLGAREEGSRTALPMWMYFMAEALRGQPEAPLPRPSGVVTARISADTGLLALAGTPDSIFELFRESDLASLGTDPGGMLPADDFRTPVVDGNEIF